MVKVNFGNYLLQSTIKRMLKDVGVQIKEINESRCHLGFSKEETKIKTVISTLFSSVILNFYIFNMEKIIKECREAEEKLLFSFGSGRHFYCSPSTISTILQIDQCGLSKVTDKGLVKDILLDRERVGLINKENIRFTSAYLHVHSFEIRESITNESNSMIEIARRIVEIVEEHHYRVQMFINNKEINDLASNLWNEWVKIRRSSFIRIRSRVSFKSEMAGKVDEKFFPSTRPYFVVEEVDATNPKKSVKKFIEISKISHYLGFSTNFSFPTNLDIIYGECHEHGMYRIGECHEHPETFTSKIPSQMRNSQTSPIKNESSERGSEMTRNENEKDERMKRFESARRRIRRSTLSDDDCVTTSTQSEWVTTSEYSPSSSHSHTPLPPSTTTIHSSFTPSLSIYPMRFIETRKVENTHHSTPSIFTRNISESSDIERIPCRNGDFPRFHFNHTL